MGETLGKLFVSVGDVVVENPLNASQCAPLAPSVSDSAAVVVAAGHLKQS